MVPVIARKEVTLSSGAANVNLGFIPDFVDITVTGVLASGASGDVVKMTGKPAGAGLTDAKIVGLAHSGSTATTGFVNFTNAEVQDLSNTNMYGLALDFASTAGIASGANLTVVAYRING